MTLSVYSQPTSNPNETMPILCSEALKASIRVSKPHRHTQTRDLCLPCCHSPPSLLQPCCPATAAGVLPALALYSPYVYLSPLLLSLQTEHSLIILSGFHSEVTSLRPSLNTLGNCPSHTFFPSCLSSIFILSTSHFPTSTY